MDLFVSANTATSGIEDQPLLGTIIRCSLMGTNARCTIRRPDIGPRCWWAGVIQDETRTLDADLGEKVSGLRADSAARRTLPPLREQPVVTAAFIADHLGVSRVAAYRAVDTLVSRGFLTRARGSAAARRSSRPMLCYS